MVDFAELARAERDALRQRLGSYADAVVAGPYGPLHWTVLTAHVFWDAWLHERDITQPLGLVGGVTAVEEGVITLYSFLIASVPAALQHYPFEATVALTSEGRHYRATVAPGQVSVRRAETSGDEDLQGELAPVMDSLAGRGAPLEEVLSGDPRVREPLTWLRSRLSPAESA